MVLRRELSEKSCICPGISLDCFNINISLCSTVIRHLLKIKCTLFNVERHQDEPSVAACRAQMVYVGLSRKTVFAKTFPVSEYVLIFHNASLVKCLFRDSLNNSLNFTFSAFQIFLVKRITFVSKNYLTFSILFTSLPL